MKSNHDIFFIVMFEIFANKVSQLFVLLYLSHKVIYQMGAIKNPTMNKTFRWIKDCVLWYSITTSIKITEGFLTQNLFHSTSLATLGSSRASVEAKFFKEFTFLGFVRYFSAKIEQSSKMSKTELKNSHYGWFFKVSLVLAEK